MLDLVEVVSRAIENPQCTCEFVDIEVGFQKVAEAQDCPKCTVFGQACAIVAALDKTGMLLPSGVRVRHEWGSRSLRGVTDWPSENRARVDVQVLRAKGEPATLVRRKWISWRGPWDEVPEEDR